MLCKEGEELKYAGVGSPQQQQVKELSSLLESVRLESPIFIYACRDIRLMPWSMCFFLIILRHIFTVCYSLFED